MFSVLIGTKGGTLKGDVWTVEALVYWGAKKGSQSVKLVQLWQSVDPSTSRGAGFRGSTKSLRQMKTKLSLLTLTLVL